jgi:DNA-binding CsgD family transcriptional regulator
MVWRGRISAIGVGAMLTKQVTEHGPVSRVALLTEGQRECLRLVGQLLTSKDIGLRLGLSPHSVDDRIRRALQTLEVSTRAQAAQLLASYERETPQQLMHQPPQLVAGPESANYCASLIGTLPFGEGVRNELAEGQAAFPVPGYPIEPRERWSFRDVFLAEHNLPIVSRIAVILGVALAGVVLAALLVNLAEGFSRLA